MFKRSKKNSTYALPNQPSMGADLRKKSTKSRILNISLAIMLIGGVYILSLVFAPKLAPVLNRGNVQSAVEDTSPKMGDDRIYIPKIGVNYPLAPGEDEQIMQEHFWHRSPDRGNPLDGGNFILSAHRWKSGKTPLETVKLSPMYNVDKLTNGDKIYIDWLGVRYIYQIDRKTQVARTATYIEDPLKEGEDPHMTLYTCTLEGWQGPRVVVIAKLLETQSDTVNDSSS